MLYAATLANYDVQGLRSATKTSNKVSASYSLSINNSALRHLEISACDEDGMPIQKAKRGMPKCRDRVEPHWDKAAPNYWPSHKVIFASPCSQPSVVLLAMLSTNKLGNYINYICLIQMNGLGLSS